MCQGEVSEESVGLQVHTHGMVAKEEAGLKGGLLEKPIFTFKSSLPRAPSALYEFYWLGIYSYCSSSHIPC